MSPSIVRDSKMFPNDFFVNYLNSPTSVSNITPSTNEPKLRNTMRHYGNWNEEEIKSHEL